MPHAEWRVFVYGTLMPGQSRWRALEPFAAGWRPATARGRLWDTGRGFPAVRFDEAGLVPGFVVAIDGALRAEAVAVLDGIEREGVLYRRVRVSTSAGGATSYEWLGSTDGLTPLPDGWPGAPRAP